MKSTNALWKHLFTTVFAALLFGALLSVQGCKKDDDKAPDNTQSIIKEISTIQGGVLALEGVSLVVSPQTVPRLANGENATVNFSVEVGIELPKALPSNFKLVGKTSHFGPEGFIFAEPMFLLFKMPDGVSFDQVSIIGYDNVSGKYGVYPITYYDEDRREVGANVYELGYYMLANVSELNRTRAPFGSGAFRINIFNNREWYPQRGGRNDWANDRTYQKLVITNFVPTYPEEMVYWAPYDPNSNGGQRYWEAMTPPQVDGFLPNHLQGILFRGPQGTYTAQLVNSHKFVMFDWPECRQYSMPFTFTITGPVTCTSATTCSGWSMAPAMPGGGTWDALPCYGDGSFKPLATIPVCTGDFQTTLTWFNGSGSSGETDLDLHLFGPDNLHIYYGNKNPGCPCGLLLDRDMISETGWVQENICANSLAGMPRGDYRLEVDLFSGQDKDFQVRVLRGAQSNTYSGRVTSSDQTKTILEFKL